MRGPATLLATLLLLAPSAGAVGLLAEVTRESADLTFASVRPVFHEERRDSPAPPLPAPLAVTTSLERPHPDDIDEATIALPEGAPADLQEVSFGWTDAPPDAPPVGRKAERVDTHAALGARLPAALPQARLPLAPAGAPLPMLAPPAPPAHAGAPATREAPEPRREAPVKEAPEVPEVPDAPWIAAAAGAATFVFALLVQLLLYHRTRGWRTLEHAPRARLAALLREHPGLTPAHAARLLGVDPTTALYHLRRLAKEGLAIAEGPRRGARYFAAGAHAPEERVRIVATQGAEDVLRTIEAAPGATKTQLAERLAIARASLAWHLTRLERAGLVRYERAGRVVRVFAKETLS